FQLKDGRFAEVQYFFGLRKMVADDGSDTLDFALAMVSLFTSSDPAIARDTHGALMACRYQGDCLSEVLNTRDIVSVVTVVPLPPRREEREDQDPHADELYSNRFFVVGKLWFDMTWNERKEEVAQEDDADDENYVVNTQS
ncbi:hypothetical protein LXA43DRAFT_895624, partial [Ganoderma leucocontextum]